MAFYNSAHNLGTGEHFGFDVISLKVSQIELQSIRKSDNVLRQYPDREIPPIYVFTLKIIKNNFNVFLIIKRDKIRQLKNVSSLIFPNTVQFVNKNFNNYE